MVLGLDSLNSQLNQMNADSLFHWLVNEVAYTPTADTVTIGAGGNIDIPRPMNIDALYVDNCGQWEEVTQVAPQELRKYSRQDSGIPCVFSYSGYPVASIRFDIAPVGEIRLFIRPAFSVFSLDDEVVMPPEYEALVRWSVAVHLCRIFGTETLAFAQTARDEELNMIQRATYKRTPATNILSLNRTSNIFNLDFT
jgi:hypothetical protein